MIALVGPTASGKTAAALALAEKLPIEVISVDSALVYRGMDIGTAKPTRDERTRVPHHLIDILEPTQAYSAADFWRDAHRLAQEIRARGNHPLLVGGTMLYIKALREGIDHLPSAVPEVRAAIEAQAAAEGWPALHAELARVDPATAARLPPHDAQRIARALEVWRVSGKPLSAWFSDTAQRALPGTAVQLVSLEPEQRGWLHERIAQRFAQMMNDGFLEEVRRLRARRSAPRSAQHALCGLPPGLACPGSGAVAGGERGQPAAEPGGDGRGRHPTARQAPVDLAARHARPTRDCLRCPRRHRTSGAHPARPAHRARLTPKSEALPGAH